MSPTPGTRRSSSITRVAAKLPSASESVAPLLEVSATIKRKLDDACRIWMPWRRTSSGSRCSTARRRFCTSICAMSISVPDSNVTVIEALPFDWLVEDMYRKPSTPLSSCSITWVTLVSSVAASAPG